ncbi:MAG: response regulator transcription factor [Nocardioidaceae bacterium]
MTQVLIVDDHQSIRLGLSVLFAGEPDLEVCAAVESGEAGLDVALTAVPDVVVMDLTMPGMGGVAATRAIRERCPTTRVLVLSAHGDASHVRAALDAGASGYVFKGEDHLVLLEALRAVARGEVGVGRAAGDDLPRPPNRPAATLNPAT